MPSSLAVYPLDRTDPHFRIREIRMAIRTRKNVFTLVDAQGEWHPDLLGARVPSPR
jgi:hypothetical protein